MKTNNLTNKISKTLVILSFILISNRAFCQPPPPPPMFTYDISAINIPGIDKVLLISDYDKDKNQPVRLMIVFNEKGKKNYNRLYYRTATNDVNVIANNSKNGNSRRILSETYSAK